MNTKSLIILTIIFAAVAGIYFVIDDSHITGQKILNLEFTKGERLFPDFHEKHARRITITKEDFNIELTKKDADTWVVSNLQNRKVERAKIARLLGNIQECTIVELRKGRAKKFGLDTKARATVVVTGANNKELATCFIGSSLGYNSCFVKLPEQETIIELSEDLERSIGSRTVNEKRILKTDHWYDLEILRLDKTQVEQIEITRGQHPKIVLKKFMEPEPAKDDVDSKDGKTPAKPAREGSGMGPTKGSGDAEKENGKLVPVWKIIEPKALKAEQSACRGIASVASILFAKGYADGLNEKELGLTPPSASTTIILKDGTKHRFNFGTVTKEGVVMKMDQHSETWMLERFNYEGLVKSLAKLRSEEALPRVETIKQPGEIFKPIEPDVTDTKTKKKNPQDPIPLPPEEVEKTEEKIKPDGTLK